MTEFELPKQLDIEVKELDASGFKLVETIKKSPLASFMDEIDREINILREENERLRIANNSLMETMGTLERAFDLAWSECFGPEAFAFLKQHFRSRLGL